MPLSLFVTLKQVDSTAAIISLNYVRVSLGKGLVIGCAEATSQVLIIF